MRNRMMELIVHIEVFCSFKDLYRRIFWTAGNFLHGLHGDLEHTEVFTRVFAANTRVSGAPVPASMLVSK